MDIFNAIERLGLHEYVGNAKGDTVGLVISNLSPEIKASLQTPWNAIGILGGQSLEYEAPGADTDREFIIQDQYPKPGKQVEKGSIVRLYNH